jgi:hypothetical protein
MTNSINLRMLELEFAPHPTWAMDVVPAAAAAAGRAPRRAVEVVEFVEPGRRARPPHSRVKAQQPQPQPGDGDALMLPGRVAELLKRGEALSGNPKALLAQTALEIAQFNIEHSQGAPPRPGCGRARVAWRR